MPEKRITFKGQFLLPIYRLYKPFVSKIVPTDILGSQIHFFIIRVYKGWDANLLFTVQL